VRPARRALLNQGEDLLGGDRVPEGAQALHDAVHARRPFFPELPEEIAEPGRLVVKEVPQDVHLAPGIVGVDFDARHDLERRMVASGHTGRSHRVDRVVVGHREDSHAALGRLVN